MGLREMIGRRLPAEQSRRGDYFAVHEHRQEAERLSLVLDDVLQSDTDRSATDLALIGILHALLSSPGGGAGEGWLWDRKKRLTLSAPSSSSSCSSTCAGTGVRRTRSA